MDPAIAGMIFERPHLPGHKSKGYETHGHPALPEEAQRTFEQMCRTFRWRSKMSDENILSGRWPAVVGIAPCDGGYIVARFADVGMDDENRPHTLRATGLFLAERAQLAEQVAHLALASDWPEVTTDAAATGEIASILPAAMDLPATADPALLIHAVNSHQRILIGDPQSYAGAEDFWNAGYDHRQHSSNGNAPMGIATRPRPKAPSPDRSSEPEGTAKAPTSLWISGLLVGLCLLGAGLLAGLVIQAYFPVLAGTHDGNESLLQSRILQYQDEVQKLRQEKENRAARIEKELQGVEQSLQVIRSELESLRDKK